MSLTTVLGTLVDLDLLPDVSGSGSTGYVLELLSIEVYVPSDVLAFPFSGPGRRLRITPTDVETLNAGGLYHLKWAISERDGGDFLLDSAAWSLIDPSGATMLSGAATINNTDQWLGRTRQTILASIDLRSVTVVPVGVEVAEGGFPYKMLVNVDPLSLRPPGGMKPDWQTRATAWMVNCYLVFDISTTDGDLVQHRVPVRILGTNSP
jgi:hypothetical protein